MGRAGWSKPTIKRYLRWEFGCVALYIAEAPLALSRAFATSLCWGAPGCVLVSAGAQGSLAGLQILPAQQPRRRRRLAKKRAEPAPVAEPPEEQLREPPSSTQ